MEFMLLILTYVLYSLGLDTISRRRGVAHPWLSWIPCVNCFQLGCIADQYKLTRIGHRGIMRWVLLILGFVNAAVIGGFIVLFLIIFFQGVLGAITVGVLFLDEGFMMALEQNAELFWMTVLFSPLLCLPYWIAKLIAQYKLYQSCRPDLATLFLLLNIFLPFVTPILIMICKDRDDGMVQEYLY